MKGRNLEQINSPVIDKLHRGLRSCAESDYLAYLCNIVPLNHGDDINKTITAHHGRFKAELVYRNESTGKAYTANGLIKELFLVGYRQYGIEADIVERTDQP